MKAIERFYQYIDYKDIKPTRFEKNFGLSNGYLGTQFKRKGSLGEDILNIIIDNCLDINPIWLLTGNGEMLKAVQNYSVASVVNENAAVFGNNRIPLVNITAIGGFSNGNFTIQERDVKDYYIIPKFKHKKIDFMIEVEGSSMYPNFNSGDIVACRVIKEKTFIQWNKAHVIATRGQGIILKRVKKGIDDKRLLMISDNKDYEPFEVPKEEISSIAIIIGVIRLE